MIDSNQNSPLVSVPVITYNSAKTVLETLESIKAQTYPNIELIISDDCSTDDTVEICQNWLNKNSERFVRTELITVDKNTGVAENCNRVRKACRGEWVKGIAGDDILIPNCVQDCMEYVAEHPETVYLFGRCKVFGADKEYCNRIDSNFDYAFFAQTQEQQLHRLIFKENCIPATTLCYNREADTKISIRNDERIPLLEDWPKWINLLKAGVKFHFVNKVLVKYRVGNTLSTRNIPTPGFYESNRLFFFIYQAPEYGAEQYEELYQKIIKEEMAIYREYYALYQKYDSISRSHAYRLGLALLKPVKWIKRLFMKLQ